MIFGLSIGAVIDSIIYALESSQELQVRSSSVNVQSYLTVIGNVNHECMWNEIGENPGAIIFMNKVPCARTLIKK